MRAPIQHDSALHVPNGKYASRGNRISMQWHAVTCSPNALKFPLLRREAPIVAPQCLAHLRCNGFAFCKLKMSVEG